MAHAAGGSFGRPDVLPIDMRTVVAAILAVALLGWNGARAQQDQGAQTAPAVPGLGGIPTLGAPGSDQPAWMPKPLPVTPPRQRTFTAADAMQELRDFGYYDIKPLHESDSGFSTQAWRYGKQVSVNISKRDGFVSQAGANN